MGPPASEISCSAGGHLPPLPRHLEFTRPGTSSHRPCDRLGTRVIMTVPRFRHRPSIQGQPLTYILFGKEAFRHDHFVMIPGLFQAPYRLAADFFVERYHGLPSAAPFPVPTYASLPSLQRVDSVQIDSLTDDFDRVGVNYARDPGDFLCRNSGCPT